MVLLRILTRERSTPETTSSPEADFWLYLCPMVLLRILTRERSTPETTSSPEADFWLTSTSTTQLRLERFGASAPTPTDPTSWWTAPRESSTSMKSRTLALL